MSTPDAFDPRQWSERLTRVRVLLAEERAEFEKLLLAPAPAFVLRVPELSDERRAELFDAIRDAPSGELLVVPPDTHSVRALAVIEAARALAAAWDEAGTRDLGPGISGWSKADDAAEWLVRSLRAYEAAGAEQQQENDGGIRQD